MASVLVPIGLGMSEEYTDGMEEYVSFEIGEGNFRVAMVADSLMLSVKK
ncbi:hypothetical protein B817_240 [Weissella confusa]|nr:hypothetical protein [Weissella confusa]